MTIAASAAGVTLQVKNPSAVARVFASLGLPISEDSNALRTIIDSEPVPINLVSPFPHQDLSQAYPLGAGITVDLFSDDVDEAYESVRAFQYTVSQHLAMQADGRRSFTFIIPDSGGYCVRVIEAP